MFNRFFMVAGKALWSKGKPSGKVFAFQVCLIMSSLLNLYGVSKTWQIHLCEFNEKDPIISVMMGGWGGGWWRRGGTTWGRQSREQSWESGFFRTPFLKWLFTAPFLKWLFSAPFLKWLFRAQFLWPGWRVRKDEHTLDVDDEEDQRN